MSSKKAGTEVITWESRMEELAQDAAKLEESTSSGGFISFRAGVIAYQGATIGETIDVIVVDHILENCYYEGRFDPDNPVPPVCYAFGRSDGEMAPHPESSDPQNETCKGCPHNEFGSADTGKGKACKNTRRLAVLPADKLDEDSLKEVEVAYMKIPVTSVKGWASYVRTLSALEKLPPLGVVTTVGVVKDAKTQFKVLFKKASNIASSLTPTLFDRYDTIKTGIDFPYPKPTEEAQPKKNVKRKF